MPTSRKFKGIVHGQGSIRPEPEVEISALVFTRLSLPSARLFQHPALAGLP
jgi:hypothetical protein